MSEARHYARQDRPVQSETADRLDRGQFVDNIIRALVVDDLDERGARIGRRATGYVIGLSGRWGSGKSSILNLINDKLVAMEDVVVATFNPWIFKGRDELVVGFFNSLRGALGRSQSERARSVVGWLDRYWGAVKFAGHGISATVDAFGGGGVATTAFTKWEPHIRSSIIASTPRSPDEERAVLEQKIVEANFPVVILIDELDRVEDEEVRAVAQLVKAVGEIKGLSYLVAFDADRVIHALGRGEGDARRESGERYLEKIIQHTIPIRPLFDEDARKLLNLTLEDYKIDLKSPENDTDKSILQCIVGYIETPRDVKRLVGAYSVIWRMIRDEISPYDVLGYCWILTKSYQLRDRISERIDDLVRDPVINKMTEAVIRRMNKESAMDIEQILGVQAIQYKEIFKLIFPNLFQMDSDDGGGRLSRRRNLIRMLYLGNPPGMPGRAEIETLWREKDLVKLENKLRLKISENKLGPTLDRVDDLAMQLTDEGDATFWLGVSKACTRRSDWLLGPEVERALSEDIATTILRIGQRDRSKVPRVKRILEKLIEENDFCIAPWIVKKHIFAFDLTDPPQGQRGGEVLSRDEMTPIIEAELERYRVAVINGTILRRVPRPDALICLAVTNKFGDEARQALTDQLRKPEAAATFAGLMIPPGHIVDRAFLNILFDAEEIQKNITRMINSLDFLPNVWINSCLRRMHSVLS